MKKTKLLTSLAALALVVSLGACEVNVGDVNIGGDSSDTTDTESSDTTTSDTGTTESGDTGSGEGGDTGEGGGDGSGESRLGLLGEAFKLVGAGNYTLSSYSTAVSTDDHLSYTGVVTDVGVISTNYANNNKTSGMIEDPEGGFVEVELVDGVLVGQATPDTSRSIKDYFITSDIDTSLFEEKEDGLFALKDEGFNSDVLGDLFPDKPFTGGLNYATQGTIFIDVADDLSKITYYYDSSFLGTYTVTLVVTNLGTTVFPYDLETDYVRAGSIVVSSWAEYLSESVKAQIDELLGKDLDEVLPFYLPDEGYEYARYQSSSGGRFNFGGKATQDTYDTWETLLTQAGYTYTDGAYYNDEGYKVTIQLVAGYFDLYLYPPEKIVEPTTWAEYLSAEDKAIADSTLGKDLDDLLPFYAPEGGYTSTNTDSEVEHCFYIVYDGSSDVASALDTTWKALLGENGWTENGSSGYEYYYVNDDGYTITIKDWSFMGTWNLYIYAPVEETPAASTWNEYITDEVYRGVIAEIFGSVEILDEILPFYIGDTEPDSITAADSANGYRLIIKYNAAPSGIMDTWVSILTQDGWEQTDYKVSYNETYTFEKDGYTVELNLEFGEFDLYLYPPVDTGDEGSDNEDLETAQAILDAAAAQTNGYQDFECVNVQARYSNGGGGAYQHSVFDLTNDSNNNVFGREMYHDEAGNDERANFRYYYEKNYYRINNGSGANAHYDGASYTNNSVNSLLSNRLGTHDYDVAFDNASSIVLADATDFELTTEANGNYKLTFIYNNTWYCYKADTNLNLVGAGHAINWSDNYSYEIYYGEEESVDAFNAIMDEFFADEYWFPTVASDDEIAQEILDAADDCDTYGLDWDEFHGEYIDESTDETDTLYLTTDGDGLYGSGICLDDGDPYFEYYYKNGKEYVHNNNWGDSYSINESEFYYGDTYADILSDFTSDALDNADWPDLDDDEWTLSTLTDGYELVVDTYLITTGYKTTQAQLVYITDTNFNITGLGYATFDSTFGYIEGWYAEQATNEQVEASLEGFDLTNWGEGDGGDEATPSWADYMTETAYNTATSTLGKTLDEVLPVVLPDGANYAQISASATRIQLDASYWDYGQCPYDYETLNAAWNEALIADGWSCTFMIEGKTDSVYNTTYATYTKDGYQVEIQFYELYEGAGMWGWDLNLTVIK